MAEKSIKAGDFDARTSGPKGQSRLYLIHGLPFVIMTTVLVLGTQLILSTLSSLMNLVVISVFDAPDLITSPFAASVVLIVLIFFGLIGLAFIYGMLNRILTVRIWHEKQNRRLDRQLGLGVILLVILYVVHLPLFPFYVLWVSGMMLEQIVFFVCYAIVVSMIDGAFAKYLATLDLG
ncbi:MAG: hypothetical protein ACFFED_11075 [Candidatus Thorarchaeota archaeon]